MNRAEYRLNLDELNTIKYVANNLRTKINDYKLFGKNNYNGILNDNDCKIIEKYTTEFEQIAFHGICKTGEKYLISIAYEQKEIINSQKVLRNNKT